MKGTPLTESDLQACAEAYRRHRSEKGVAKELGLTLGTAHWRIAKAADAGLLPSRRPRGPRSMLRETVRAFDRAASREEACRELGISPKTLRERLQKAQQRGLLGTGGALPLVCNAAGRARRRREMTRSQQAVWREFATLLGRAANLAVEHGQARADSAFVVSEALGIVSGIKPGVVDKTRRGA